MDRNNFTEGSIEQAIFDHWNTPVEKETEEEFVKKLTEKFNKKELAEFIARAQSCGRFGNRYIHPD